MTQGGAGGQEDQISDLSWGESHGPQTSEREKAGEAIKLFNSEIWRRSPLVKVTTCCEGGHPTPGGSPAPCPVDLFVWLFTHVPRSSRKHGRAPESCDLLSQTTEAREREWQEPRQRADQKYGRPRREWGRVLTLWGVTLGLGRVRTEANCRGDGKRKHGTQGRGLGRQTPHTVRVHSPHPAVGFAVGRVYADGSLTVLHGPCVVPQFAVGRRSGETKRRSGVVCLAR